MAENDVGKIVNLIMENPELVEKIRELAQGEENTEGKDEAEETASEPVALHIPEAMPRRSATRRTELLRALKPYLSEDRGKAIESMMSIADIIDMMRSH